MPNYSLYFAALASTATMLTTQADATVMTISYNGSGSGYQSYTLNGGAPGGISAASGSVYGTITIDMDGITDNLQGQSYQFSGHSSSYPTTKLAVSAIDDIFSIDLTGIYYGSPQVITDILHMKIYYSVGSLNSLFANAFDNSNIVGMSYTANNQVSYSASSNRYLSGNGTALITQSAGSFPSYPAESLYIQSVLLPVPEPATWAMMLLGFGGIGIAMRRQRRICQVRFV